MVWDMISINKKDTTTTKKKEKGKDSPNNKSSQTGEGRIQAGMVTRTPIQTLSTRTLLTTK